MVEKLPVKVILTWLAGMRYKIMDKKIRKNGHPDGFVARVITIREDTYGLIYRVDILECGICILLDKQNIRRFTPIMCEVYKITTSLTGLELIRKGTIASGAEKCDFRFKKKKDQFRTYDE